MYQYLPSQASRQPIHLHHESRWIRGSSSSDASWEFWTISVSRDGRLTRVETFDIGHYGVALARYGELVAADAMG